jgi:diaminohydroxyphosphoribosylaminopyrimidine deaminase/5-amino-6-(5-phosphoribosylamino)uracil reductase
MVGAVVVKDGQIVGEGYHGRAGDPHAEVVALAEAGDRARGARLYVTLEPCCHFGRTPPCSRAVIASGVASVVVAMVDPNPKVAGTGIRELEAAGIDVEVGLLGEQARKLNESFVKHITTGLPFVTLKMAMTLDGKIATRTGDSKWISCERSRRIVHDLRERCDAIMVGVGTVVADDPELTARVGKRVTCPLRVVVDSRARTPFDAKVIKQSSSRTVVAVTDKAPREKVVKLEQAGARILLVGQTDGLVDLKDLTRRLGESGVTNLLIEGGGRIAASALAEGIVDKVMVFIAPKMIGGEDAKTPVEGLGIANMAEALQFDRMTVRNIGCDILIEAYPCSRDL